MDVPRVSIDVASTSIDSNNSTDSKNEVQYLKTVCTYEDKNTIDPSKAQQPSQVITIQESDESSFTKSEFSEDGSTLSQRVHYTSTIQQKLPKNN